MMSKTEQNCRVETSSWREFKNATNLIFFCTSALDMAHAWQASSNSMFPFWGSCTRQILWGHLNAKGPWSTNLGLSIMIMVYNDSFMNLKKYDSILRVSRDAAMARSLAFFSQQYSVLTAVGSAAISTSQAQSAQSITSVWCLIL